MKKTESVTLVFPEHKLEILDRISDVYPGLTVANIIEVALELALSVEHNAEFRKRVERKAGC